MKSVLVTGSNGLLGQKVVDALINEGYCVTGVSTGKVSKRQHERFTYISTDLTRSTVVERIFSQNEFSHVIHLAAIAHVFKWMNISWSRYYRVNTIMSRQVFECASVAKIPVFFSSSVDVYGITNGLINENTKPKPIGAYAKSKYLSEKSLMELANQPYLIARFAPIYTEEDHRDIQKRYYIRYPKVCYLIGKGLEYEFLSVDRAVSLIIDWCKQPNNYKKNIINVCDDKRINTKVLIEEEKKADRAKYVLHIPMCLSNFIFLCMILCSFKKNFLTFMISKVIKPIRIEKDL